MESKQGVRNSRSAEVEGFTPMPKRKDEAMERDLTQRAPFATDLAARNSSITPSIKLFRMRQQLLLGARMITDSNDPVNSRFALL